jgi:hypothetical protein
MWSVTDDEAFHKRRYSRKDLIRKLESNNFSIIYLGAFVFTLFPFMFLSRVLNKRTKKENSKVATELDIHPFLNGIFRTLMRFDELLIRAGIILPFGGSIFCVAEKKG